MSINKQYMERKEGDEPDDSLKCVDITYSDGELISEEISMKDKICQSLINAVHLIEDLDITNKEQRTKLFLLTKEIFVGIQNLRMVANKVSAEQRLKERYNG